MDFLNVDNDVVVTEEKDSVGGFQPYESNIYDMVIKAAYFDVSSKGANNVTVLTETAEGRKFKFVEYITSAAGKNYYIDKKDGTTKRPMVGFSKMNGLAKLLTGTELAAQTIEDKVHKIWDKSQSKEVPQSRKTLTDWTNKKLKIGIQLVAENKSELVGDKYVKTADVQEVNKVDKFFNEEGATLNEIQAKADPTFINDWIKANKGKVIDRVDKSIAASAPTNGAPQGGPITFDS